jgi:hypothetical protein
MEWTTIPIELLERILVSTASPKTIAIACRTCKSWNAVDQDPHLWKVGTKLQFRNLYQFKYSQNACFKLFRN